MVLIKSSSLSVSVSVCMHTYRAMAVASRNTLQQRRGVRCSSSSSLQPPDLTRLAQTARISLTPQQVEEFSPKIHQLVNWFGQLQNVDLQSIEPAIRADTDGSNWRDDLPETFENREAIVAAVPNYKDSYIKVPKVLNKE